MLIINPLNSTPSNTSENLKKVSLILFIILGLAHMLSGSLMSNGIGLPSSLIINRVLAIPFAMTALIYGLTSIKNGLKDDNKIINNLFIAICLFIFIALIYINFFVPDKIIA